MVVECTAETEVVFAVAVYSGNNPVKVLALHRAFYGVLAIGRGAPLEVLFVVDVSSSQEHMISRKSDRVPVAKRIIVLPCTKVCCNH